MLALPLVALFQNSHIVLSYHVFTYLSSDQERHLWSSKYFNQAFVCFVWGSLHFFGKSFLLFPVCFQHLQIKFHNRCILSSENRNTCFEYLCQTDLQWWWGKWCSNPNNIVPQLLNRRTIPNDHTPLLTLPVELWHLSGPHNVQESGEPQLSTPATPVTCDNIRNIQPQ